MELTASVAVCFDSKLEQEQMWRGDVLLKWSNIPEKNNKNKCLILQNKQTKIVPQEIFQLKKLVENKKSVKLQLLSFE